MARLDPNDGRRMRDGRQTYGSGGRDDCAPGSAGASRRHYGSGNYGYRGSGNGADPRRAVDSMRQDARGGRPDGGGRHGRERGHGRDRGPGRQRSGYDEGRRAGRRGYGDECGRSGGPGRDRDYGGGPTHGGETRDGGWQSDDSPDYEGPYVRSGGLDGRETGVGGTTARENAARIGGAIASAVRSARQRFSSWFTHKVENTGEMSDERCISRAKFLFGGFVVLGAGVAARLAFDDLYLGPTFAAYAENLSTAKPTIPAKRGTIYDRNGNVIATSVAVKDVSLCPREFNERNTRLQEDGREPQDAAWVASTLAGLEGAIRTADEIEAELATNDEYYAVGKLHMDTDVAESLSGVNGVNLADAYERQYPYGSVAGQVVGVIYEGDDGTEQHTGLESYYQDVLGGTDGSIVVQRGLNGQPIPGAVKEEVPVENGHDIVTTLDIDLQQYAESKVAAAVDEWSAKSGQFVVMDAETGEIYAIGSTPYVDPSDLSQASNDALSLKPVTSTAEPGSTFKVVTAAALLNERALAPDTEISIPPALTIDDFTVSDSHEHGYETLTFRDIIVQSLNTGTVIASRLIPRETFFGYIRRFGFLETPAVDYPGAASAIVLDVADWNEATAANVPFGQGISVSAVSLVRALASVNNEGTMCTPHLLLERGDDANAAREDRWETEDVIDAETCAQLNEILRGVVEDSDGTGNNAAVKGYTVAGKTGTAQKVTESGAYSDTDYVTSFIGWLPGSSCKLVCYVSLDSPQTSAGGGLVAGPVFSDIMSFVCDRYKVPPDTSSTAAGVPDAKKGAGV